MSVLVAGSLNVDLTVRVPHLPEPGETVLGPTYSVTPGGKGANQAVACARAGARVHMLGAVGKDSYADLLRTSLSDSGVDLGALREVDAPTGAALIGVADGGENSIMVASGANARLAPDHLPDLSGVSHLVMQLEIPLEAVTAYARAARQAGVQVVLNAAPARALGKELLTNVNVLIVNEGELKVISDAAGLTGDVLARARGLQNLGPSTVVVTLGGRGCLAVAGGEPLTLPAFSVQVVDTTGAGDTFVGVLIAGLTDGDELESALSMASAAAALACTRTGAQPSMPTRDETLSFLSAR